jgi:omega-amidase
MRAAIVQSKVTSSVEQNKISIIDSLRSAAIKEADIVLFPECALTGYLGFDRMTLDDLRPEDVHGALAEIQRECAVLAIGCVVGQYFKRCGRWYNNAVAIGRSGELLASYDKLQLVDLDCYEVAPGQSLGLFEFDKLLCSMAICHDIRYPEVLRQYGSRAAKVHFHLFYGGREPGEQARHYQAQYDAHVITRAVENGFYLLASNASLDEQMIRSQCRDMEGRALQIATSFTPTTLIAELDTINAGDGWAVKRRDDLFDSVDEESCGESYFERGVWSHKNYMIKHQKRETSS